ncbi:MAG: acetoin utilization protein AcuC [Burkholderiales bacterium]|nr:acetoin utilization protein AcuC [Burkholderiales bacterium]
MNTVGLYVGEALGRYGFPRGHPFGPDRQAAFWAEARSRGLDRSTRVCDPVAADRAQLERFCDSEFLDFVVDTSQRGEGFFDSGDTPAFPGAFEAASHVAGSALDGLRRIMDGELRRTFQPIGGLHHARRDAAAGFCIVNDTGVVIETLRALYGIRRVAYVDIDVHHGDGVFYAFESDPEVYVVDMHQDGRTLYPGTGFAHESGQGAAKGTKLNIPLAPGSGDETFIQEWQRALDFLRGFAPEFVILQCGADSIAGDPLALLRLTAAAHALVARDLCRLAEDTAQGRIMGFGGGGYNRRNLAQGWNGVLQAFIDT